jgi:hypothetical protein
MSQRRKRGEVAQNVADRRRREDDAPRLQVEVPRLARLSLSLGERGAGGRDPGSAHIRRVVMESAAALFLVPCSAPGCPSGAHDLTTAIMPELLGGSTRFEGETGCDACGCVMSHLGDAEYR